MERDEPMKLFGANLLLQQPNLNFGRILPKFAVQFFSAAGEAGGVQQAAGIAGGINEQTIALRHLRATRELLDQPHEGLHTRGFVAVNTCEKPELYGVTAATRPVENETRKLQFLRSGANNAQGT